VGVCITESGNPALYYSNSLSAFAYISSSYALMSVFSEAEVLISIGSFGELEHQ